MAQNTLLTEHEQGRLSDLARLQRADRLAAMRRLAAGVAHEIRNPLTAIRSTIQYLIGGYDEEEPRRQLLEQVLAEVDRINGTIRGLLNLSGSGIFTPVMLDLREPLQDTVSLLRQHAARLRVELELELPRHPLPLLADADQLKQVFLNLMLNALDAMPNGGQLIVVASGSAGISEPEDDKAVEVRFLDTGLGIAKEDLARVFDPFFTTKQEGTGLGLAICRRIVEKHRGDIRLAQRPEGGTAALLRFDLDAA